MENIYPYLRRTIRQINKKTVGIPTVFLYDVFYMMKDK
ncbi:hypothetical protein B4119_1768 [Parageobacillus caldoxylosilyticus]|uniref:Uncharacterized protein n=1 Tax=Saccharococcus caldoxylosilyticus TaxID=81408 RepID=A0A150LVN5_9BACL|nr:hypothetical protein B4119_1768 [Parageobacillus caldoxylosilyticus]